MSVTWKGHEKMLTSRLWDSLRLLPFAKSSGSPPTAGSTFSEMGHDLRNSPLRGHAVVASIATAGVLIIVCHLWRPASPAEPNLPSNINLVFGLRGPQTRMPEFAWLGVIMLLRPLAAVASMHWLFNRFPGLGTDGLKERTDDSKQESVRAECPRCRTGTSSAVGSMGSEVDDAFDAQRSFRDADARRKAREAGSTVRVECEVGAISSRWLAGVGHAGRRRRWRGRRVRRVRAPRSSRRSGRPRWWSRCRPSPTR